MELKKTEISSHYQPDDEIDLFELFASLMRQWRWLVGITVLGMIISVIIALLIPKQYEVTAQVAMPNISNAMELANAGYSQETNDLDYDLDYDRDRDLDYDYDYDRDRDYDAEKVFQQYYDTLMSRVNFNKFLQAGNWVSKIFPEGNAGHTLNFLQSKVKEDFSIEIVSPKAKKGIAVKPRMIELKMMGLDEQLTANFIGDYIKYSGKQLLDDIKRNGQKMSSSEKLKIKQEIDLLRTDAKITRKARIYRLKEALVLAKKIGISKPDSVRLYSQGTEQGATGLTAGSLGQTDGMFLLGSEYLKGEVDNLQKRTSDDAFIDRLPGLFKRLEELDHMTFDFTGIQPYRIDKIAEVDGKAEKPKRALIVAVGTVLSGFIAIFVALIMGAVKRRRGLA